MKKKMLIPFIVLLIAVSGCIDREKPNSISTAELTEREKAFLSITSDHSYVFDFTTDSSYKEAAVWIEKYEFGEFTEEIGALSGQIEGDGSIFIVLPGIGQDKTEQGLAIGIASNESTVTMRSPDIILGNGLVTESSSTSFPDESISLDGERVLASIYFTENKMISQADA